jgi:hypothetical protein
VLSHTKCNVAPLAMAQLYEIESVQLAATPNEPEAATARLNYLGESELTQADLLAAVYPDDSDGDDAADFLRAQLADGSRPKKELVKLWRAEGFTDKVMRRAREKLGITTTRFGYPSETRWSLPAEIDQWAQLGVPASGLNWPTPVTAGLETSAHHSCAHKAVMGTSGLSDSEAALLAEADALVANGAARWI